MGNLIYVYGDSSELETALGLLADAGLADKGRVIEARQGDASHGRDGARRGPLATHDPDSDPERPVDVVDEGSIAGAGVVPPAAALGAHVPLGTTGGAVAPYAVPAATGDAADYAASRDRADLRELVGGNREEAEHYADVLRGGGSLLVVEAEDDELDRVEEVLADHDGQGAARR